MVAGSGGAISVSVSSPSSSELLVNFGARVFGAAGGRIETEPLARVGISTVLELFSHVQSRRSCLEYFAWIGALLI